MEQIKLATSTKPIGLAASKYAEVDPSDGQITEIKPEEATGEPDSSSAALASVGEPSPSALSYDFLH